METWLEGFVMRFSGACRWFELRLFGAMFVNADESKTVAFSGSTESRHPLVISFLAFKGGRCVDKGCPVEVIAL